MPEVWYWAPNSMSETLRFRTEVQAVRTKENRVSYMDASQILSFGYAATDQDLSKMEALYLSDPNASFLIPEWPTATFKRSGTLSATDTVIAVEDEVVYVVGQQVMIGRGETWEQAEVDSKTTGSITLTAGLAGTYIGSPNNPVFVAPLVECICPEGLVWQRVHPLSTVQAKFLSVAPVDLAENPYDLYGGLPLIDDGKVAFEAPSSGAGRASILVDTAFGSYQIIESEDYTRKSATLTFFDTDYASRLERRRFMHFMRGKDGEMWISSDQNDLKLTSSFTSSSISLNVGPIGPVADLAGRVVQIVEGSNSAVRAITGATVVSPTVTQINLNASVGFAGTASARVSFLTKSRFDTDEFELQYVYSGTGLMARFSAPTIEVA